MDAGGAAADEQGIADLAVRPTLREEDEDLAFARCQPEGIIGIGGWNG